MIPILIFNRFLEGWLAKNGPLRYKDIEAVKQLTCHINKFLQEKPENTVYCDLKIREIYTRIPISSSYCRSHNISFEFLEKF